jgi:N-acetylglutamate synthase-like GNAT family acetyltransferase
VRINPIGLDWHRFIIAVDQQDHLIGCGQVKPHQDGSLELASIAVQPEWRQRGVARAIIMELLSQHSPPLYLTCRSRLGPFYERFGFNIVSDEKSMPIYFRRIHRLVGWLSLSGLIPTDLLVMQIK